MIVQNGTSSCIYSATEQATVDMMGQASISELCRDVPFALVQEAPDACSANLRNIAKTVEDFSVIAIVSQCWQVLCSQDFP